MRAALGAPFGVLLLLGLGGCRIREEQQRVVLHDEGLVCLGGGTDAGPVEIAAVASFPIVVRTVTCLTPCATKRKAKCSARRDGDRVVVTSDLSWEAPEEIGKPCGGECTVLEASCAADGLPSGSYTVVLGKQMVPLQVPTKLASACGAASAPSALAAAASAEADAASVLDAAAPRVPFLQPAAVAALAAPPSTGALPTPPKGDAICAIPYPAARGAKGAPVGVTVTRLNPCEGNSCSAAHPKCTLKRQGSHIVLKTEMPAPNAKPRMPCTDDCSAVLASCRTDALPPGNYTIELGARKLAVQLPLAKQTCTP